MGQLVGSTSSHIWVLAATLAEEGEPAAAFTRYQQLRMAKARQVVEQSWRLGRLVHLKHPVARAARNLALRAAPAAVGRRQLEGLYRLGY